MKTRNSFVSNSSTSSFVIINGIATVSLQMFDVVISEYRDDFFRDYPDAEKTWKKTKKNIEKAVERKDVLNGEVGICFPSTNYHTYILKTGKHCLIDTCNNHDWYDIDGHMASDLTDEQYAKMEHTLFVHCHHNNKLFTPTVYDYEASRNNPFQLQCSKCSKDSDFHKYTSSYVLNEKDNKYCDNCFRKLKKVKKTEDDEEDCY